MSRMFGGSVTMGSCDAMFTLVTDFWRKKLLTDFLLRSFGRKLFQFPQFLVGRIVDYVLAPAPTYFISDMMNFIPGSDGRVTAPEVLAKIDQVWNDHAHPTWFEAPKDDRLIAKIFLDLYYFHNTRNITALAQEVRAQRDNMKKLRTSLTAHTFTRVEAQEARLVRRPKPTQFFARM